MLKAAHSVSFTAPDDANRKAQVWLVGYGESALKFELIVWPTVDSVRRPAAIFAAYTWAIDDALRGAGIEVPYPQRDVRLRGLFGEEGDDARAALRLEPRAGRKAKAKAAPSPPATTPPRTSSARTPRSRRCRCRGRRRRRREGGPFIEKEEKDRLSHPTPTPPRPKKATKRNFNPYILSNINSPPRPKHPRPIPPTHISRP